MHLALQLLAWLLALLWLAKLLETAVGLPRVHNLALPAHDLAPTSAPTLAVIVPARNEAFNIAACLRSLLAQDYPHLRILAIDDRSTDQTAAILHTLASPRLEVLQVTHLPAGWLGKTHAMALAARHALAHTPAHPSPPTFLLFTDADIVFHPQVLRRALAYAESTRADHLVVMPTALSKTHGEAMLLSFLQVLGLFAVRPWKVADPHARDAIGVGAFNLIRTSAYLHLGGFDATPLEIVEDLALGRRVKAAGLAQRAAYAPGMVELHWAAGLFGLAHGMTKNFFAIFRFQPILLLAASVSLAVFCLGPLVFAFGPPAFALTPGLHLPGLLTLAAIAGMYALASRRSRISPFYAALYPASTAIIIYSMLRSMAVTLRDGGVTWRGTFYPLSTLRRPPPATTSPPI